MSNIIYIVYDNDGESLSNEKCLIDSYQFVAKYFTDFNKAKACCDYYNLCERKYHQYNKDSYMTYKIASLEIGDNVDYESLYKIEKEEQAISEQKQKEYLEKREYEKYLKLKEKYEGAESA